MVVAYETKRLRIILFYSQKLAFSDDENEMDKGNQLSLHKEQDKTEHNSQEASSKNWNASKTGSNVQQAASQGNRARTNEEEEVWIQRRRLQSEEVAMVIERAKQRKEEEEKRFLETKQAAAKKLQQLEEKINRTKHDKEVDDSQGTINPSVVPPQPINPVPIPVPEWERDKEGRSHTPVENTGNNKGHYREASDFRKLAQIEGRSFVRKEARSADRDSKERERDRDMREPSGPSFSKQFQSNLPPRFQKQQQQMRNANSSPQPQSSTSLVDQYEVRWQQNQTFNKSSNSLRKGRQEIDEFDNKDKDEQLDSRKSSNDDNYRTSSYRGYSSDSHKMDERDFDNRQEKRSSQDLFDEHNDKFQDRFERPQRPDSRDSRTSRESRHSRESARDSEPREYHGSWADTPFEPTYDDRRKEHFREDRRAVPGPITKERIEAEDLKPEKKNLTQLKRGYMPEKRMSDIKKEEPEVDKLSEDWNENKNDKEENSSSKAWADAISPNTVALENPKFMDALEKPNKDDDKMDDNDSKKNDKSDKEKDDKRGLNASRRRSDPRHQGWGVGCVYHRSSWSKKSDPRRGSRIGGPKKLSGKSGEWHATDSDVSIDEISVSNESGKDERSGRSKPTKKYEKDEKNKETKQSGSSDRKFETRRDNYVPRGEPSRHGRGAGNFSRTRGGLSKRIDGYGPPPSKSPFGQLDEKKNSNEDASIDNVSSDEKTKQSQQALSAGIIGSSRNSRESGSSFSKKYEDKLKSTIKKSKGDGSLVNDNCDTSDNSDENGQKDSKSRRFGVKTSGINRSSSSSSSINRRNNPPPRFASDKRSNYNPPRPNSNSNSTYGGPKKDPKSEDNKPGDYVTSEKPFKKPIENTENTEIEIDEKGLTICDSDGFQEVKSKKTGQRQKSSEDKPVIKPPIKTDKDNKTLERKKSNGGTSQLTPQQIANIPSLMDTPINPPVVVPQPANKNQFVRQNKLPPRFAKQRENNRLQKVQMQQGICDVNDMNKVNINMYNMKDASGTTSSRISNAWEKPLSSHLRTEQENIHNSGLEPSKTLEQPPQTSPSQSNSPNIDKVIKSAHLPEKTVLDGATPPVTTIIFENTNFKSAPGTRPQRTDKTCSNKLEEGGSIEQSVISSFNKPIRDLLNKNEKQADSIQMQLTFSKEDSADMKLDFFESEISHLTEDKSSKNIGLARSMHAITSANNTLSPSTADALNFKIASVKKVWETMSTVIEHSVGQDDSNSSFTTSFGPDPNSLDPSSAFGKGGDTPDDGHEGYASSPSQPTSNNTTNVCKVSFFTNFYYYFIN